MNLFRRLLAIAVLAMLGAALLDAQAQAQSRPAMKVGYAKCAHCFSMLLMPQFTDKLDVELVPFNTASDALTALMSRSIDIAQLTYLHYVTAVDRGFDVVAITGHVNGGSDIIMGRQLGVPPGDWEQLSRSIAGYKAQGKPFRVATSRGSAQDLHMRGALAVHGIDPAKDVTFINVPNPSDHAAVLARGEAEMICMVEPFASQARLSGAGVSFGYPYDQAAGRLSSLILTRGDVVKERRPDVQAAVDGVVRLVEHIKTDQGGWRDAIVKSTGLERPVADEALKNLFPDSAMYRNSTLAIGGMMKDLRYTSGNNPAALEARMDYSFVEKALGKKKEALGY
jgi:ABC-type nitrate/sulfonate/bicarbonate transport system substrate-binding protein